MLQSVITVSECEKAYVKLLASNGITSTDEKVQEQMKSVENKRIGQAVIDGNSIFILHWKKTMRFMMCQSWIIRKL